MSLELLIQNQQELLRALQASGGANLQGSKAVNTLANTASHRPLYEDSFFQDAALQPGFMNAVIQPQNSIVGAIPAYPTIFRENKVGFVSAIGSADEDGGSEPNTACDACMLVEDSYDFLKMEFPFGRLCRRGKTLEVNELIRRARMNDYTEFYIQGDIRGVNSIMSGRDLMNIMDDRNLVTQAALRRVMWSLGNRFRRWMHNVIWTGNPSNNSPGTNDSDPYMEFWGLLNLINGDYPNSGLPVTAQTDASKASLLNSLVIEFNDTVGGGNKSIVDHMYHLEHYLTQRARQLGFMQVEWGIYMHSALWSEITRTWPCEMAGDGCGGGVVNANDGGNGLFNMSMREQMRAQQALTLNGRTYPVYFDDYLPVTTPAGAPGSSYTGDIFFIPFSVGGQQTLYFEYMDYSQISQELGPIPGSLTDALGWTDGGRYHHAIEMERWCFEVQTKMEPRLIFRAPHLAARLDNVTVTPTEGSKLPMPIAATEV